MFLGMLYIYNTGGGLFEEALEISGLGDFSQIHTTTTTTSFISINTLDLRSHHEDHREEQERASRQPE